MDELLNGLKRLRDTGVLVIDSHYQVVESNTWLANLCGYQSADLQGLWMNLLVRPEYRDVLGRLVSESHDKRVALSLIHKQGHTIDVSVDSCPLVLDGVLHHLLLVNLPATRSPEPAAEPETIDDQQTLLLESRRYLKKLKETEERIRAIVDTAVDGVITIDSKGHILSYNPAAEKIFGYGKDEILGRNVSLLMPESFARHHDQSLHDYNKTGKARILGIGREVQGKDKSGKVFPMDLSVGECWVGDERIFTGIVRDISERKDAERRIRVTNQLLDAINDAQTRFIHGVQLRDLFDDLLGELLSFTDSEQGFVGEVIYRDTGQPCLKVHSLSVPGDDPAWQALADGVSPGNMEFTSLDNLIGAVVQRGNRVISNDPGNHPFSRGVPDGHPSIDSFLGVPLFVNKVLVGVLGLANRPQGFDSALADFISPFTNTCAYLIDGYRREQYRSTIEHSLREHQDRMVRSQTFANIGTWDWNIQTGDLYWSEQVEPVFGYAKGTLETSYEQFLDVIHADDRQEVIHAVNGCVAEGKDFRMEYRCVRPDGTQRWVSMQGDVIRDTEGTPLRMLGVVQDVTKQKQAEQALLAAKTDAENANQAKSDFLSSMSHELRTPLNAILGFAQLFEFDASLNDAQKKNINEIQQAGKHLLELINEVLDLAKIESGRMQLELKPISLHAVFSECCTLTRSLADKHGVMIHCDIESVRQLAVLGDFTRLKQVLLNLMSNAVKYNREHGEVTVTCETKGDDRVVINIADTGPGIPADRMQELFKPFNRLGAECSEVEGTGIGLVITRQIVELMRGSIHVESQEGQGSIFSVELALATTDSATASDTKSASVTEDSADLAGIRKVLYVEDNPGNVRLMARVLETQDDSQLLHAATAEEGILLAQREKPDVIVMDINLPGINGLQAAEELKKLPETSDIPVIALSANAMQRDIDAAMEQGFLAYLTKPLDIDRFFIVLEEVFVTHEKSQQATESQRILLVDDNITNQDLFVQQLGMIGYQADVAANGKEGYEKWRDNQYGIVITDCNMPVMNGYELAAAIRNDEADSTIRTPIVAFTANSLKQESRKCRAAGMDDVLVKPVDVMMLKTVLGKWIGKPVDAQGAEDMEVRNAEFSPGADDNDAIDTSLVMQYVGGDSDKFCRILSRFSSSANDTVQQIVSAGEKQDKETVKLAAHKLKGSSRYVGAHELANVCMEIEHLLNKGDWKTIEENCRLLRQSMEQVDRYIKTVKQRNGYSA
jgi:PAS domain S-box-containing protein